MGRRRSDEDLRETILDSTEELLAISPSTLTARAVQRAAGVSSGTFFHYFPTIDALLLGVATRAAERQPKVFGDLAREGLPRVLRRLFDPKRRDVVLPWLRQRAIDAPSLQQALRAYDQQVSARLIDGVRDVGTTLDVEATVEVVRALAEGFQLRLTSNTLAVDPARFARAAVDLIVRAAGDAR